MLEERRSSQNLNLIENPWHLKPDGKTRPLAIACFEDKMVDWVVAKILTAIYDPTFIRNSFGYRSNKSANSTIEACYNSLKKGVRAHMIEIDFKSFFNTIPHRKLMKILGCKVKDHRLSRLIVHFLKGGILDDADRFLAQLQERVRVQKYGLRLHPEKTKKIKMNKTSKQSFDFLGFTFFWGKQRSRRELKVKTQLEESRLKQILKSLVWEFCMRGSVRVLPCTLNESMR